MAYVLDAEDIKLETYCNKCYGVGTNCPTCKGVGTIPTSFGEKVLQFIRKHYQK